MGEVPEPEDAEARPDPDRPEGEEDPRDQEIADLRDRLARARADYENLRKRMEREATALEERARGRVVEPLLHVFEFARLAAQEAEKHPGALAEGVKMMVREFERLLEGEGIRMTGLAGEPFDATRHEAIAKEHDEGHEAGTVLRVAAPGYLLGDRVLRYAKVVVATLAPDDDG